MSQKLQKYMNTNELSKTFGKYYLRPVYDDRFVTTGELADFIQTQCTVKRSDIKAVLDELGAAFKHYFELGQKIRLEGIGIFKVGVSSACSDTEAGCTAALVKKQPSCRDAQGHPLRADQGSAGQRHHRKRRRQRWRRRRRR